MELEQSYPEIVWHPSFMWFDLMHQHRPQCTSLYLLPLAVLRTVGWLNFGRWPVLQVSSASCLHTGPDVYFPLLCTTHGTQDSRLSRTTFIHQLYKCRAPTAFTRQMSIPTQCILQESIHVAALTFMLHIFVVTRKMRWCPVNLHRVYHCNV
jgi:hypothetical protein